MIPKLLIVGRVAWTQGQSTLSGIFNGYPADRLAYICIETKAPDFSRCINHFQISEVAMLKKLYRWNTKTGLLRNTDETASPIINLEQKEHSLGGWVRNHRSNAFLYVRELLWRIGGWKSDELLSFINKFNPDVLFFMGDPLPLVVRLQRYILNVTNKPAAIFLMDDVWGGAGFLRCMLRREVAKLVPFCKAHFVISELMKKEYDALFQINSEILTKGIPPKVIMPEFGKVHSPMKIVYTGKLIYGRDKSLAKVAQALERVNEKGRIVAELHIYTQTVLTSEMEESLNYPDFVFIHKPVPYKDVVGILEDSDIVLFVESLEKDQRYTARLSFSTKVTDYLASGKCIFAVGDAEIAPISYLRKNGAAVVADSYEKIPEQIYLILTNPLLISEYAQNAYLLGQRNHGQELMHMRLVSKLNETMNMK